jgi:hypothetical protein
MNRRVYNALRKVANNGGIDLGRATDNGFKSLKDFVVGAQHLDPYAQELQDYLKSKPYLSNLLKQLNERYEHGYNGDNSRELADIKAVMDLVDKQLRAPAALDAMKTGKTIGAGAGGLAGIAAGLLLAKDKDLLSKILYSGGLGALGAGAGAALGDTVADYTV